MTRPHLYAAWLALLALALTATAAPLPFPRKGPHPALRGLQGEWELVTVSAAPNSGAGKITPPPLTFSVKGDRLRLSLGGRPHGVWAIDPRIGKDGKSLGLILTHREGAVSDGVGCVLSRPNRLLLGLAAEDVGLAVPPVPSARRPAPVMIALKPKRR